MYELGDTDQDGRNNNLLECLFVPDNEVKIVLLEQLGRVVADQIILELLLGLQRAEYFVKREVYALTLGLQGANSNCGEREDTKRFKTFFFEFFFGCTTKIWRV